MIDIGKRYITCAKRNNIEKSCNTPLAIVLLFVNPLIGLVWVLVKINKYKLLRFAQVM